MKENKKDNLVYIDDMLGAVAKIRTYSKSVTKENFLKEEMRLDAVVRNLEIIGEAASRLSPSFREKHGEIEWKKIIGMRNRIIHAYDYVDYEIVWDVIKYDLVELEEKLKGIVKQ